MHDHVLPRRVGVHFRGRILVRHHHLDLAAEALLVEAERFRAVAFEVQVGGYLHCLLLGFHVSSTRGMVNVLFLCLGLSPLTSRDIVRADRTCRRTLASSKASWRRNARSLRRSH